MSMWVKLKGFNDWINLEQACRIEIRDDGKARIYMNNKDMIIASPQVMYLGKEYNLSTANGMGLLAQAPWTMTAASYAVKKQMNAADKEDHGSKEPGV
jgi:hypothetical protein